MSVYIVDHDHIDALLTVATGFHVDFTWETDSGVPRSLGYTSSRQERSAVGRMLLTTNMESVASRCGDLPVDQLPGTIGQTPDSYRFRAIPWGEFDFEPVDGLSLIACYEYQSCEHPGWPQSEAWRFCQALRAALIRILPGYDDAPGHYIRGRVSA